MKRQTYKMESLPRHWVMPFLLAALGQIFLSRATQAWTLGPGILLDVLALLALRPAPPSMAAEKELPGEWAWFSAACLAALFFRLVGVTGLPSGLYVDQGLMGGSALRILQDGWRPFFEVLNYQVPEPLLYYQLAAWFSLAGAGLFSFHLFFALLSLAAFPLIYWTFRQWAGPRTALPALFLLAVCRWDWVEVRNGFPSGQLPFYSFGALAFFTYGWRNRRGWALVLAALFTGAGLYTYQAFKVFPFLLLFYGFLEWKRTPRRGRPRLLPSVILLAALAAPLAFYFGSHHTLGNRERDLFLGHLLAEKKSLAPALRNWAHTGLMFNRWGDENPRHNLPGLRMLDDATGLFFVLGLGLAWRRRRETPWGTALAGLLAFSLPCLLSVDAAHSNRMLGVVPFVLFLAAGALEDLRRKACAAWGPKVRPSLAAAAALLLGWAACQNSWDYFGLQARDPRVFGAFDPGITFLGRAVGHWPGPGPFYVAPAVAGNNTFKFLAHSRLGQVAPYGNDVLARGGYPRTGDPVFLLGDHEDGTFDFLRGLFPRARWARFTGPAGDTEAFLVAPGARAWASFRGWDRGLTGTYWEGGSFSAAPLVRRRDPLLNFTGKAQFPFTTYPPFRIRWTGTLETTERGLVQFMALTTDPARLFLDGKPVPFLSPVPLARGPHPFRLDLSKDGGDHLALTLVWKKEGGPWRVVPASAFGKAP